MRTLIATALFSVFVSCLWGQQIPSGTLLPVMLSSDLKSDSSKPGEEISAKLFQEISLPAGIKIKKNSKVVGHVVSAAPPSDGKEASITVQFDQIEVDKKIVTISTGLRAMASMQLVAQVRNPVNTNAGPGTSVWDLNASQVGGQIAYNGAKIVKNEHGKTVGRVVQPGWVVGIPMANPDGGCMAGKSEQAFWLFSTDACGLYDEKGMGLSSGIGEPNPGKIVLTFPKHFEVRSGSGWLLQVN